MKLTILGKYGPYPAAGGGTSSYLLRCGKANVALDFGSGACGRYKKYCDELDAIVLSHLHFDHVCDLLPLVYEAEQKNRKLLLYMPFTDCKIRDLILAQSAFDVREITDGMSAKIGEAEFSFTKLVHPTESYGMKISCGNKSIFYSGDTSYTDKVTACAKGCSLALLDAAQPEDSPDGFPHMNVRHARKIADGTGARVIITHVNPLADIEKEADRFGLETARETETYEI